MSDQVSKTVTKNLQTEVEKHTGQRQQEQLGCVNMRAWQVGWHGAAFDSAIREKVMGYGSPPLVNPLQLLLDMGLPFDAANDLVIELTRNPGALLEDLAVPRHVSQHGSMMES